MEKSNVEDFRQKLGIKIFKYGGKYIDTLDQMYMRMMASSELAHVKMT